MDVDKWDYIARDCLFLGELFVILFLVKNYYSTYNFMSLSRENLANCIINIL